MAKPVKPMPDDPQELASAIFRGANRKLVAKGKESETKQSSPDTSTASQPSP